MKTQKLSEVSWNDIEINCKKIATKLKENDIKFDAIICIGRDSMIPSRLISEYLAIKEVHLIPCKSYQNIAKRGSVEVGDYNFKQFEGKELLIVDDICITGLSIKAICNKIFESVDEVTLTTATIYANKNCDHLPDVYAESYDDNATRFLFPWQPKL